MLTSDPREDDRSVVPVIAVLLMVAITTILAAIAGFFVLDTDASQHPTPQAEIGFHYNDTAVIVSHQGGQTFDTDNTASLEVSRNGTPVGAFSLADGVSTGDTVVVSPVSTGDVIRVTWTGPEGESSNILDTFTVP